MVKCEKCGNEISKDGSCSYCIWKGDAGPGLQLREMIKAENDMGKHFYDEESEDTDWGCEHTEEDDDNESE